MEGKIDIVGLISNLLDSGKYTEALNVPKDEKYLDDFKDNCWDLISNTISKISDDTAITKPSLQRACEELLTLVVHTSTPEEALLEFIEQIEVAKNDAQFNLILGPLQQVLIKLSAKRGRSLEWSLNSISTYIESIPRPDFQLEDKERLLMDCDVNVRRIVKIYSILPPFYTPFVKEILANNVNIRTKQIITAFLISLLGKPLIYLDLDPEVNSTSEARQSCSVIVQDICMVEKNVMKFLIYLESCHKKDLNNKKHTKHESHCDDDYEINPYDQREKINTTTLSGLFYTVLSGHFNIPELSIPQVYSIDYIVNTTMVSVVHFLGYSEYGPLLKGISLCHTLLDRLPEKSTDKLLTSTIHIDLCKTLVNVAIYCTYETIRKNAVNLIDKHINKFDYKDRCLLIKYIFESSNHSGMMGYAISLYKKSLNEAFQRLDLFPESFTGPQFLSMVKKFCHLPHGAESDLVELADQIITCLNFLRYVALKDTNNITDIRNCFKFIEAEYLDKLRIGLNMSKAHYEVKLKDIEENKYQSQDLPEVTINIGGNILDKIPTENKKEIIHSALNAFHLIEGLVARLSECININKTQAPDMDCH